MKFDVLILPFEPNELGYSYRVHALAQLVSEDYKFINVVNEFTGEVSDLGNSIGIVTDLVLLPDGVHGKLKFHGPFQNIVDDLIKHGCEIVPKLTPSVIGKMTEGKVITEIEKLVELKLVSFA